MIGLSQASKSNLQIMRRLLVNIISIDSSKIAPKFYHIGENKQTADLISKFFSFSAICGFFRNF